MDTARSKRNPELDIIKGGLVLIMLLYHCASVSSFPVLRVIMGHIDFIHTAFILLTGFLCGYHYYATIQLEPSIVQRRLLIRAWKIFAIFFCANVTFYLLGYTGNGWSRFITAHGSMPVIFAILISIPGDLVAFEILYIIAIFLVVAGFLVHFRQIKWILGLIILLPIFIPGNLMFFVAFGCAGMLLGILAHDSNMVIISAWIHKYLWIFPIMLILMLFVSSLPQYHLGHEMEFPLILIKTIVWFYSFVCIIQAKSQSWIYRQVVLLGRYTLIAYIFQMICARITYLLLIYLGLKNYSYYGACLILVTLFTWMGIKTIQWLRDNWLAADRIYHYIFV